MYIEHEKKHHDQKNERIRLLRLEQSHHNMQGDICKSVACKIIADSMVSK